MSTGVGKCGREPCEVWRASKVESAIDQAFALDQLSDEVLLLVGASRGENDVLLVHICIIKSTQHAGASRLCEVGEFILSA